MREDFISGIRNLITNKREYHKEINLNILGYLHVIGFSPSKLLKGKRLYNEIINFINANHLLDKYNPEVFENIIFEKLIFYVHQHKWQIDKVIVADEFKEDMNIAREKSLSVLSRRNSKRNLFLNTVEYGIIDRKASNKKYTETDVQLTRLLNEFNDWIKDYLKFFTNNQKEKNNLVQLLKLIVSK